MTKSDLDNLATMTGPQLLDAGCALWDDEVDASGRKLYLLPASCFYFIPFGLEVETISGRRFAFGHTTAPKDAREGHLSFGVRAHTPVPPTVWERLGEDDD